MGLLIGGKWSQDERVTSNNRGEFNRQKSLFRETISNDHKVFKPEKDRYHLYVSYACPWAHRALIARKVKKLENIISFDVVHPDVLDDGWTFDHSFSDSTGDSIHQKNYLYEIYQLDHKDVTSRVTVPVLWDKKTQKIVNNESSEILRILNSSFTQFANESLDLYPKHLRDEIDAMNKQIYEPINNGVYKTGFAKNQQVYEKAFDELFSALDLVEKDLEGEDFLVGSQLTEADIRLITTLLRFDIVYYTHFKCNYKRISDYRNLNRYVKNLYNNFSEIKETTYWDHIKRHYYYSHNSINPYRIIAKGPLDLL